MQPVSGKDAPQRQVSFTLQREDLIKAYQRSYFLRWHWLKVFFCFVLALLVFAGCLYLSLINMLWSPIVFVLGAGIFGGVIGVTLVPLTVGYVYLPIVARRIFRQQHNLRHEGHVEWDDMELRVATVDVTGRTAWANLIRWGEDRDIILLFHSELMFNILPKRVLSPEQIVDLRTIAANAGISGAAPKR